MKKATFILLFSIVLFSSCPIIQYPGRDNLLESKNSFNIYCWNKGFKDLFEKYFAHKVPKDITVNWVITPFEENAYQNTLDNALLKQNSVPANEKIDVFLVEDLYALKYVDTDCTLDVINDIGLTQTDLANQYQYTKDIMTDSAGAVKGVSWQACPGGFMYRRSYMRDVIGTDDPEAVQVALSNWDGFDQVAAQAKNHGYYMLSGYDDAYRVFSYNMTGKWVDDYTINIDPQIERWIAQTKMYTDNGYNNKANLWSSESIEEMGADGKVIGYFGPGWFVDYVLKPCTKADPDGPDAVGNGSYGDWGLVKGPQGFNWGGTWICGASGSDNTELIRDMMYTLTVDTEMLSAIATELDYFANNIEAMTEIANSDYSYDFLGGQNHIGAFHESAMSISRKNISPYDQGMNEKIFVSFQPYFNGEISEEQAWNNFYKAVSELYPELITPIVSS